MSFIKNLFTPAKPEKRYYTFKIKCNRCGEIIEGRVDLDNDLSLNEEGDGYLVRKGLIGSGDNHCFQQIEVTIQFSSAREATEQEIQGGTFVDLTMDDRQ
ncbi:MAG TPA: hypothetical protein DCX53_08005 [Anaerolineae bacterium]|nr:hypothetical protein [Anaerolineae bacterium]